MALAIEDLVKFQWCDSPSERSVAVTASSAFCHFQQYRKKFKPVQKRFVYFLYFAVINA